MRQGQQQNRRGRGRPNNNRAKNQNPLTRSFQSNGPDVKIHGTPAHIAEKYITLARDSLSSGDIVMAENYLQHAEHYNRIIMTYREQQMPPQNESVNGGQQRAPGRSASEGMEVAHDAGDARSDGDGDGASPVPVAGSEPQPPMSESRTREDARGRRQTATRGGGRPPPRTPRAARSQDRTNGEQSHADAPAGGSDRDGSRISDGQDAPGFLRTSVAPESRRRSTAAPKPRAARPATEDDKA